jgi:ubiquinone/menaquinone biosynthesis C-methylase UbiE
MQKVSKAEGVSRDQTHAQSRDDAVGAHYASRRMAARYAKLYQGSGSVARFLRSRQHLVSLALADLRGGDLLDVGCGPGMFVRHLLETRSGEFHITAVDRSPAMVEACTAQIAGDSSACAVVARIEALPFENESFDVVLAMGVLEYTDAATAVTELARVTRPHGRVVVTMHNPLSPYRFVERYIYGPAHAGLRNARSLARSRSVNRERRGDVKIHTVRGKSLRRMMEDNGLRPVETVYYDVTITVPPFDRYVRRWAKGWQKNIDRTIGRGWWKGLGTAYMTVAQKQ